MSRKNIIICLISVFLMVLSITASATLNLEYKDYIIKPGDTLWDISAAELKDPFLWPNIWKENPDIENPDLIYPDQFIKIPVYLVQRQIKLTQPVEEVEPVDIDIDKDITETMPEIEDTTPRKKRFAVDRSLVMVSGYISPDLPTIGKILGNRDNRLILGKGDSAYVDIEGDLSVGRRFYTFRYVPDIKHPKGNKLGYLIEITGIAEIVGEESGNVKVNITESFLDVNVGEYLQDYFEIEPPEKVASPRMPEIKGVVVTSKDLKDLNAEGDVVYIDKGSEDGVLLGDAFRIVSEQYPNIVIGDILVIFTKEKTSTAYVNFSKQPIDKGDYF
ncbi:MAG: LysM peptidoglycan-binding domain-containing protein [Nitrospirota bacterium]|nr:MAG: LysM peptidoglycan-binding domain-containing protein [Nitrospirota bacterium]